MSVTSGINTDIALGAALAAKRVIFALYNLSGDIERIYGENHPEAVAAYAEIGTALEAIRRIRRRSVSVALGAHNEPL